LVWFDLVWFGLVWFGLVGRSDIDFAQSLDSNYTNRAVNWAQEHKNISNT
jgi:hypothetical protein